MRSIFSGIHPAQIIDRRNVDNVDKENESGYGNLQFCAKSGKSGKSAGNVHKDYVTFTMSPAPIVINKSPFTQFFNKNFSISSNDGK